MTALWNVIVVCAVVCWRGVVSSAEGTPTEAELTQRLASVTVPDGFAIDVWATGMQYARSLTRSQHTLFVGSFNFQNITGNNIRSNIYAVKLSEPGRVYTLAKNLPAPNGVAFFDGDLYIAENERLLAIRGVEKDLANPPAPVVVNDSFWNGTAVYPLQLWHGWRYLSAKDGRLYMSIGSPCNTPNDPKLANSTCDCLIPGRTCTYPDVPSRNYIGSIISGKLPNFDDIKVEAHGIRNCVGMSFHPTTNELFFTDNGRDNMGGPGAAHNDKPPDELNRVAKGEKNTDFGFPFCYGADTVDPEFNKAGNCDKYIGAYPLDAHVAALGMRFYAKQQPRFQLDSLMFPEEYHGGVFIAQHGSWDRDPPTGYRVVFVQMNGTEAGSHKPFADGWLGQHSENAMKPNAWGRPVDVELLDDGSLLMTDDKNGAIYRIHVPLPQPAPILLYVLVGVAVVLVLAAIVACIIKGRTAKAQSYDQLSD